MLIIFHLRQSIFFKFHEESDIVIVLVEKKFETILLKSGIARQLP